VEFDKMIAESYKRNHINTLMMAEDIKKLDNDNAFKYKDADIIIGGPPCQGFSMAGARIRNGFIDDPRNYLFKHYFNIVKIVISLIPSLAAPIPDYPYSPHTVPYRSYPEPYALHTIHCVLSIINKLYQNIKKEFVHNIIRSSNGYFIGSHGASLSPLTG
jgi:hypothetical protein